MRRVLQNPTFDPLDRNQNQIRELNGTYIYMVAYKLPWTSSRLHYGRFLESPTNLMLLDNALDSPEADFGIFRDHM